MVGNEGVYEAAHLSSEVKPTNEVRLGWTHGGTFTILIPLTMAREYFPVHLESIYSF